MVGVRPSLTSLRARLPGRPAQVPSTGTPIKARIGGGTTTLRSRAIWRKRSWPAPSAAASYKRRRSRRRCSQTRSDRASVAPTMRTSVAIKAKMKWREVPPVADELWPCWPEVMAIVSGRGARAERVGERPEVWVERGAREGEELVLWRRKVGALRAGRNPRARVDRVSDRCLCEGRGIEAAVPGRLTLLAMREGMVAVRGTDARPARPARRRAEALDRTPCAWPNPTLRPAARRRRRQQQHSHRHPSSRASRSSAHARPSARLTARRVSGRAHTRRRRSSPGRPTAIVGPRLPCCRPGPRGVLCALPSYRDSSRPTTPRPRSTPTYNRTRARPG